MSSTKVNPFLSSSGCSSTYSAYVGNLRSDIFVPEIQSKIRSLFELVGIKISLQSIQVHRRSAKRPAFAFVVLQDKSMFDYAVGKLNGIEDREFVFPQRTLVIAESHQNPVQIVSKSTEKLQHKMPHQHLKKEKCKTLESCMKKDVAVAMEMNSHPIISNDSLVIDDDDVYYSVPTTTGTSLPYNEIDYLHMRKDNVNRMSFSLGQKLSNEDRLTEYKQGGGKYLEQQFKCHVGKYVCAFLNSEGGTLLIGVNDDCCVCGIQITSSRMEDKLRLEVDGIMKGFNPPVFPSMYSINFIPLHTPPSPVKSPPLKTVLINDLKVIKITVQPVSKQRGDQNTLYENQRGEVYLRRDGSVQGPLKASQILEWSRINMSKNYQMEKDHLQQEINRKKEEVQLNLNLVNELVKQKQFIEDQFQEKENVLNSEIDELRIREKQMKEDFEQIRRNKSKVCTIS